MSAIRSIRPALWLLWAGAVAVLALMGEAKLHVREFTTFVFVLLGLSAVTVAAILAAARRGGQLTREPLGEVEEERAADAAD